MFGKLPKHVTIYEVGPRDGLQNESRHISTQNKVTFIDKLSDTGLSYIEVTSFVSPKWIPQLSDAVSVAHDIKRNDAVHYSALVPNDEGLERAISVGMKEIALFISASETHNKRNVNKTIAETLKEFHAVITRALDLKLKIRVYISTVFGCPYEGSVDPQKTIELTKILLDQGIYQVSIGDTIGVAAPNEVARLLEQLLKQISPQQVAVHFHDTQGRALANCLVALSLGITTIDSSIGGLGGCPYAPGASGNVATEDVVAMLHSMNVHTGVDLDKLIDCSRWVGALVGHELPSKYLKSHRSVKKQRGTQ